jgi:ATP-dependent DNA helicase RecG
VADDIVETIYRKYFKANISYRGVQRIETYPIPPEALREAIYNAMVHRDYTSGIPIQIKVFPDSLTIYNDGSLPTNWTVQNLLEKHRSQPPNPKIAYGFYRAGYIETWGRGIERIAEACEAAGMQMPMFKVLGNEMDVTFSWDATIVDNNNVGDANDANNDANDANCKAVLLLISDNASITYNEMAEALGISRKTVERIIKDLKATGQLKRKGSTRGEWEVK